MAVVPVPPTAVDNTPKVILLAGRLGMRSGEKVPLVTCVAIRLAIRAGSIVPDVIFSPGMLGISFETSARKVGALFAPEPGPAKTVPDDCSLRVAERVPDDVTGAPPTENTPSKLSPTEVTVPPTSSIHATQAVPS